MYTIEIKDRVIFICLLSITLCFILTSCQNDSDEKKILEAQNCIDRINSSNTDVRVCMNKVEGIDSPDASLIRCSAYYLDQGFYDPQRFIDATDAIKNSGGNAMLGMMSVLAFKDSDLLGMTAKEASDAAYEDCKNTESPGEAMLSSMTRMATTIATATSIGGSLTSIPDPEELKNLITDSQNDDILGESVKTVYQVYCSGPTESSNVCSNITSDPQVQDALQGNMSNADVGQALRCYLNPAADGC